MRKMILLAVLAFCGFAYADSTSVSNDTIILAHQITVPATFQATALSFYSKTPDSMIKRNDRFIIRIQWRRAGGSNFYDSTITIQPKTPGIDTLNGRRGYTIHVLQELLPR
jgi:hypothetical protein